MQKQFLHIFLPYLLDMFLPVTCNITDTVKPSVSCGNPVPSPPPSAETASSVTNRHLTLLGSENFPAEVWCDASFHPKTRIFNCGECEIILKTWAYLISCENPCCVPYL